MIVIVQSVDEARMAVASSSGLLRHIAYQMGHDAESCACEICTSWRLLLCVVQELGSYITKQEGS